MRPVVEPGHRCTTGPLADEDVLEARGVSGGFAGVGREEESAHEVFVVGEAREIPCNKGIFICLVGVSLATFVRPAKPIEVKDECACANFSEKQVGLTSGPIMKTA